MHEIDITVDRRIRTGKNVSRRMRRAKKLPAIVYGLSQPAVPVEVGTESLRALREGAAGANSIFLLKMQGTDLRRHTMLKEMQRHPVTGDLLHVDFLRVDMEKEIEVEVPVRLTGHAAGLRAGGVLDFVRRRVPVRSRPALIPDALTIDISDLEVGKSVRISEAQVPDEVSLMISPDAVVAVIQSPRVEAVEKPEEEVEEAATTAEGAAEPAKEESPSE